MAVKPIIIHGFRGMHNLPEMPAKLLDDERRTTPAIVLNAEVTDGGRLRKRGGYVLKKALTEPHSMWSGSVMLCIAGGVLYQVDGGLATSLGTVDGPATQMSYVEIDNLVYMSNPYWKGVYDLLTGSLRSWGITLPGAPNLSLGAGDLPPGAYTICYTKTESGRLSGNGPLVKVAWEGSAQGVLLNDLPTDGQCWITHPNGQELFLAQVEGGAVTGQVPQAVPLPSFTVAPPPGFTHFCHAFGRIWGVCGKKAYYSDPFQYEWFRTASFIPFLEDLVMVAPVTDGLFVNSMASTWFLEGATPEKMSLRRIGEGAVPGTLVYTQLPGAVVGGGYEISRRLSQLPSPVWVSKNGFVAGTHTGHLVHMTEARLKVVPRSRGAGFYQVKEGIPRLVMSMSGVPSKPEQDDDMRQIFEIGRMFIPAPLEITGSGGLIFEGEGEVS
jgi:hypothetical protein